MIYCIGGKRETKVCHETCNPEWNQVFSMYFVYSMQVEPVNYQLYTTGKISFMIYKIPIIAINEIIIVSKNSEP